MVVTTQAARPKTKPLLTSPKSNKMMKIPLHQLRPRKRRKSQRRIQRRKIIMKKLLLLWSMKRRNRKGILSSSKSRKRKIKMRPKQPMSQVLPKKRSKKK
jgi:hypothetical protein